MLSHVLWLSERVSQSVTDKGKQGSNMGSIKVLITISQYAGQGARELPLELLHKIMMISRGTLIILSPDLAERFPLC